MAAARARRAPPLGAQRLVAQQPLEQAPVRRVVDLAREVLEEAVELLDVAVGDRAGTPRDRRPRRARSPAPRSAARPGSARRGPPPGPDRRARSARPARPRPGTRGPRSRPCGRAARAPGTARRSAPSAGPCASTRRRRRRRLRLAARRRWSCRQYWGTERTRYRGLNAAVALGATSRWSSGPSAGLRLQGLERRGRIGDVRAGLHRGQPGRGSVRDDRPRGVRRLPVHAPDGAAGRRRHARDRLARVRDPRGPDPARAARPGAALRPRAGDEVADVLAHRRRPGRGARHPDGGAARRAAGRRAALAAGRRHRPRVRSRADPAAGALAADVRGPDGDRRRPARRVRRRRPARPRRCGRRCRTTSRWRRTRRARSRCCGGWSRWSASPSTPPSSRTRPPTTSAR